MPAPGVRVEVGLRPNRLGSWQRSISLHAVTGTDGLASTDQSHALEDFRRRNDGSDGWVAARLDMPLPEKVEGELLLDEALSRPVELVLPETGRVVVRILENDGSPYLGAATVLLGAEIRDHLNFSTWPPLRAEAKEGRAVFEHVGKGVALGVAVFAEGHDLVTVNSPGISGSSEMEIVVTLQDRPAVWTLRAVDKDGGALARRRIHALYESAAERWVTSCTAEAVTDLEGWFVLETNRPPFLGCGGALSLELLDGNGCAVAVAALSIPKDLAPGPRAPRDVAFNQPTVLARGEVVDEDGRPVSRATVRVVFATYHVAGLFPPRTTLQPPETVTLADGSFLLLGQEGDRALRVSITRLGFDPAEANVVSPGETMRVVLRRSR